MLKKQWLFTASFSFVILLAALIGVNSIQAQDSGQNPTPIVITLTPISQSTTVPSPPSDDLLQPDRLEPNNEPNAAAEIGLQVESDLTLIADDLDYFTGYLKTGQSINVSTTVNGGLDTKLTIFWNGQLLAENDDRFPADVGSSVTFTAPADGWFVALVEKATLYDGVYDLAISLAEPTATATAAPTLTPTPSPTPIIQPDLAEPNNSPEMAYPVTPGLRDTYTVGAEDVDYFTFIAKAGNRYACETVTDQVDTLLTAVGTANGSTAIGINDDRGVGRVDSYLAWIAAEEQPVVIKIEARGGSFGQYEFVCQNIPASAPPMMPVANAPANAGDGGTSTATVTETTAVSPTDRIPLSVQYLGSVQQETAVPSTHIRLLVYYDANNDRQPGPGEGVPNVSVLAVDAQGQRIARIFTNAQGEALFNLSNEAIARVIVPFVPGWSEKIRVGESNNDIVLGLPAVRLPIFLPVQNRVEGE